MQNRNKIFRLEGVVQHYDWGGYEFIPALLRQSNEDEKPFAEYWMGAHDNAAATVLTTAGKQEKLNDLILDDPKNTLGEKVFREFGRLPYLLKILDVKNMLSIQVHPDKKSGEEAFEQENKRGIALNAANRNYKDTNHKPELMVALSDFWLLHGFKPKEKLVQVLNNLPELKFLAGIFETEGYRVLYKTIMEMPQSEVNKILQPMLDRIIPSYQKHDTARDQEDFWSARAALTFNSGGNIDRGIFSIYFFNLVHCKQGEAIYQGSGVPHAYLEGQNVEIMANSDNVLRGGLTTKHIDVGELMKHIKFEGIDPKIVKGKKRNAVEEVYETPAPDFELSRFQLEPGQSTTFKTSTADIVFIAEGMAKIGGEGSELELESGDAAVIFNESLVQLSAQQKASLYRATVPTT